MVKEYITQAGKRFTYHLFTSLFVSGDKRLKFNPQEFRVYVRTFGGGKIFERHQVPENFWENAVYMDEETVKYDEKKNSEIIIAK